MNCEINDRVGDFNFLGLVLSSNFKWTCHIDHDSGNISRAVRVITAVNSSSPLDILKLMYNTLILPYFNYCPIVWSTKIGSKSSFQKNAYI